MKMPIKPLSDHIAAIEIEAAKQTASGLYIPGGAQEKSKVLKVVAIGNAVKSVKIDDLIIIKSYTQTEVKHNNIEYSLISEEDILATVEE